MIKRTKKNILKKLNMSLKREGYTNITSVLKSRNAPEKIVEEQTGEVFQPDLVASNQDSVLVYEIEVDEDVEKNTDKFIRKCKTIQQYVLKRNGRFSLIIPSRKFDTYLSILNKNNLEKIGMLQFKMG